MLKLWAGLIFILLVKCESAIRRLGGYERLLSRQSPGLSSVSLSHGSAFLFSKSTDESVLKQAITHCMIRHPILRSYIADSNVEGGRGAFFEYCPEDAGTLASRVLHTVKTTPSTPFETLWRSELQKSLNLAEFPAQGPLWKLTNVISTEDGRGAWVLCVNHGTDDQQSLNILLKDLIKSYEEIQAGLGGALIPLPFPPCVEEAVAPGPPSIRTLCWAIYQLYNALRGPAMVPFQVNREKDPSKRSTYIEPFTLSPTVVESLRKKCAAKGVTITSALSAAMLCVTAAAIQNEPNRQLDDILLRFLLSVDLRPFGRGKYNVSGTRDWAGGTVACAAGAVDFLVPVAKQVAERGLVSDNTGAVGVSDVTEQVWEIAARCKKESTNIIERQQWVPESVRLFGLGMQYADILKVVELDARSGSLGRGFSCGVSNMGKVDFIQRGPLAVTGAYYATSHSRNGVLCQLSCMTLGQGEFCGCLQFTDPLIPAAEGVRIRNALESILLELSK